MPVVVFRTTRLTHLAGKPVLWDDKEREIRREY